ncbi:MAG: hypothetical protein LBQ46_02345 [Treponema sp.]|jgi:hypothetical protein|nr:hypothetical protein [Treponema sp.]
MTEDGWTYTNNLGVRDQGVYTRTGDTAAIWYSGQAIPQVTKIKRVYSAKRMHTQGEEYIKN